MNELFVSGNFLGLLGLLLITWVGIRLAYHRHYGGWLIATGALLFGSSIVFRLYVEALIQKPLHLSYSHTMITLATAAPTLLSSIGFVLMPLGLLIVVAKQKKEFKQILVSP